MYRQLQTYIAGLLLVVLSATLIPAETFHHHEESTVVCHEASNHYEEPFFECDLCDFVLPLYENGVKSSIKAEEFLLAEFKLEESSAPLKRTQRLHQGRAPPRLG